VTVAVGIEKLRVYPCSLALSMERLCAARDHDPANIRDVMLIDERSVNPPYEDPVTMAVNAAKPMLTDEDRAAIELLIVGTESSVDQEKPISAWVHRYLGLRSNCRTFEIKHACYGGTAALQMAMSWVASGHSSNAKALIITTDESRAHPGKPYEYVLGAGAVAVLVSNEPRFLQVETEKSGYFANEVDDLTRPTSRVETGNSETSLLSYLDALDGAYDHYVERTGTPVDFDAHFKRNIYHVPFGGITFLAHKTLLCRDVSMSKAEAWSHFERKSLPALRYTRRMGGTLSSSVFIALVGLLDVDTELDAGDRIGVYSYGSGSCAEFYSGLVGTDARQIAHAACLEEMLDDRYDLSVQEYEDIEHARTAVIDQGDFQPITDGLEGWYDLHYRDRGYLIYRGNREYFRQYAWS
jgi:3-hydroxy-3-methylglutaryl CoA synthase